MKQLTLLSVYLAFSIFSYAGNLTKPVNALPNSAKATSGDYGFIENKGQIIDQHNLPNKEVLYLYNGFGLHVQLKQNGFSYEVIKAQAKPTGNEPELHGRIEERDEVSFYIHRIDISFAGANQSVKITAFERAADYLNYYTSGTPEAGVTNVYHYKRVLYQNIYPNIDVEFILTDLKNCGGFKYNFIVHPGGNPDNIKLQFAGANKTTLTGEGNILIETAHGNIEEQIPHSYQLMDNGCKQTVQATFSVFSVLPIDIGKTFKISIPDYNPAQTLVIDPAPWATYYGGSGEDIGLGITTDTSGNILLTGHTLTSSSMATSGAFQTTLYPGGETDIFIAKFNSAGVRVWGTYYGSSNHDRGYGIVTDAPGNVFITGYTNSVSFLPTVGAWQATFGGGNTDAFILKFNSSGARQWASYYGGAGNDYGTGIDCDANGNVLVSGYTASISVLASSGSYQTTYGGGGYDAFVAKFNTGGSRLWGTYFGGSGDDRGFGIATDTSGNVLATGFTTSASAIASTGAWQSTYNVGNSTDAFVVKFNSAGVRQWATYFGGPNSDEGMAVGTDIAGNILIAGTSWSTSLIASTGAWQTVFGGSGDAFIAKFSPGGIRLWATYFGGTGGDNGSGITSDANGNIVLIGYTPSTASIASTGAWQTSYGGGANDAFVAKFNSGGSRLWSTYFGGGWEDRAFAVATNTSGNVLITGQTLSTTGIATPGAHDVTMGGGFTYGDAFIACFASLGGLPVKLTSFTAKSEIKNSVLLNWQTAGELNNDYFEVERAVHGSLPIAIGITVQSWENIGKVKGNGTTNAISNYQFTDASASLSTTKALYYRLKQIDFDGQFEYSKTLTFNLNEALEDEIKIYPNPFGNEITIEISSNKTNVKVELYDLLGIRVFEGVINERLFSIHGQQFLAKGIYFLKIDDKVYKLLKE